ncbi:MAG: MYXO-CTERM sorting domain-containing protein, partial [Polyangiaceae bacterium]
NVQGADNPLANRAAYIGRIAGWPAMSTVTLNFGTAFTNKMVQIRFRMGTDAAGGDPDYQGWLIDNLVADGITNKPFHTVVVDKAGCNFPPVADAGMDLVVDEGTLVQLDGSNSSDPDGNGLNFLWSQTVGPAVTLSSAGIPKPTFTAPMVDADTTLTFQLLVGDGMLLANDTVNVLVKDVTGMGGAGGMTMTGGTGGMTMTGGTGGIGGMTGGTGGTTGGGGTGGATGGTGGSTGGSTTTTTDTAGGGAGGTTSTGTTSNDDPVEPAGGCNCRTASDPVQNGAPAALSALGLAALFVQRRRRASKKER